MESRKKNYFLPDEIILHNQPDDIWVVINRNVFDLTRLMEDRKDSMTMALKLLQIVAGQDLSNYFDQHGQPLMKLNRMDELVPTFPAVLEVTSDDNRTPGLYWWQDPLYKIGKVTWRVREVRMINTLICSKILLKVCEEDTFEDIGIRYFEYNRNHQNYIWRKFNGRVNENGEIQMDKTLTENGILYEENEKLGVPHAIWLYYINAP